MKTFQIIGLIFTSILYFAGCSSSSNTTGENKVEEKPKIEAPIVIKSNDQIEREYISSGNIQIIDKIQFEYNQKGKIIGKEKLSSQVFDRKGFLIETDIFGDTDSIENIYKYKYDNSGLRTETLRYNDKNELINKYTYEYNQYGNKISSNRYGLKGNLEKYYKYNYDDDRNLTEDLWYDKNGKLEYKIENDYENGWKNESRSYDEKGDLVFKYLYHYDNKGNIIEEVKIDPMGRKAAVIQYVYRYFGE